LQAVKERRFSAASGNNNKGASAPATAQGLKAAYISGTGTRP